MKQTAPLRNCWSVKGSPRELTSLFNSAREAVKALTTVQSTCLQSRVEIARVWRKHALRPHRCEGYLSSNDPDFETKAADIIGLYLRLPQHAVVFCVDEKGAIQALDRKDPVLPLSPGRAERHGFEYFRRGTLSLYAAFNIKTDAAISSSSAGVDGARFRSHPVAALDTAAREDPIPRVPSSAARATASTEHREQPVFIRLCRGNDLHELFFGGHLADAFSVEADVSLR